MYLNVSLEILLEGWRWRQSKPDAIGSSLEMCSHLLPRRPSPFSQLQGSLEQFKKPLARAQRTGWLPYLPFTCHVSSGKAVILSEPQITHLVMVTFQPKEIIFMKVCLHNVVGF